MARFVGMFSSQAVRSETAGAASALLTRVWWMPPGDARLSGSEEMERYSEHRGHWRSGDSRRGTPELGESLAW